MVRISFGYRDSYWATSGEHFNISCLSLEKLHFTFPQISGGGAPACLLLASEGRARANSGRRPPRDGQAQQAEVRDVDGRSLTGRTDHRTMAFPFNIRSWTELRLGHYSVQWGPDMWTTVYGPKKIAVYHKSDHLYQVTINKWNLGDSDLTITRMTF